MITYQLTEAQEMLQRSARATLRELSPASAVRSWEASPNGFDREIYKRLGGLDWLRVLQPEGAAEAGGSWIEASLLFEELGRSLLPGPHHTAMVSRALIGKFGIAGQWLERSEAIGRGDVTIATAFWESGARSKLSSMKTTLRNSDGLLLDGEKRAVEFGQVVDQLLVATTTESEEWPVALVQINADAPGIVCKRLESLGGEPRALIRFIDVEVQPNQVLFLTSDDIVQVQRLLGKFRLLRAAELLGVAEAALDLALSYAKARVQYGRPVGAFQALQHKLANCAIRIETARGLVYFAAWQLSEGARADDAVAQAALKAGEMAQFVTAECVQAHGGLGVVDGSDVSLFYRRAKARQIENGSPDELRAIVAAGLGL